MDHAGAHYFQPAGLAAYSAAVAEAVYALHIHFCRRFCEGEIGRSETNLEIFLFEEYAQEFDYGAF